MGGHNYPPMTNRDHWPTTFCTHPEYPKYESNSCQILPRHTQHDRLNSGWSGCDAVAPPDTFSCLATNLRKPPNFFTTEKCIRPQPSDPTKAMSSKSHFAKLPVEIQQQIWEDYFEHGVVHRIGITNVDEESSHPRFLRSYTYSTTSASRRQISLRHARGGMLTNRVAYGVFNSRHHLLSLGFRNPRPAPSVSRFPLNITQDIIYLTNIHAVLLSKICSPGGPCSGKIRRVALLFNGKDPTYRGQSPHWEYPRRGTTAGDTTLEEIYVVMAASRTGIPIPKLCQGQPNEYGFLLWDGVASTLSLNSWEVRLVDFLFTNSEESLRETGFPFWSSVKVRRAIDIDV
ncbi:hypothetical protein F5Y04DRAFT_257882 [Hypomontagnella monticulosa]|nr:hypothetical protein F5Y04DRAFT_257882 [Hypomontagnella monticulosa]